MAQANIDASRRVIEEAFGAGRLEVLDEVCAEGFVNHDPIMGDQNVGGVKRTIEAYRGAFPDLSFTIEDIFAAGDKVVTRWSGQGTFENEFMVSSPPAREAIPSMESASTASTRMARSPRPGPSGTPSRS
jgi:SnoaL-like polyketide cyclase